MSVLVHSIGVVGHPAVAWNMRPLPGSDWQLAESLYLRGMPNREITTTAHVTIGALRRRISRLKWNKRRTEISALMAKQNIPAENGKVHVTLSESRDGPKDSALRQKLLPKLSRMIEQLPDTLPKDARGLKDTLTGTLSLVDASRKCEGWSDVAIGQIDIHMLGRPIEELLALPAEPAEPAQVVCALPEPEPDPEPEPTHAPETPDAGHQGDEAA